MVVLCLLSLTSFCLVHPFLDGFRNPLTGVLWQDAMDLVAGHHEVKRGAPSPFQLNGFESFAVSISSDAFLQLHLLWNVMSWIWNVSNVLQYLPVASAFLVTGVTLTTLSVREGMVVTCNCTSFSTLVIYGSLWGTSYVLLRRFLA
jgi:hypothetical protein